jgi:hypothetical protein
VTIQTVIALQADDTVELFVSFGDDETTTHKYWTKTCIWTVERVWSR